MNTTAVTTTAARRPDDTAPAGSPAYPPFGPVEALEAHLGDPHDERSVFSYAACAELDEAERFPDDICAHLERWGLHHHYVPVRYGGRLDSFEYALHLLRAVARRDLTVAVGHGKTFLGAVSAWVGADDAQAREIAREVMAGTPISWGLTERAHGSDLLAGEVRGTADGDAVAVSGEKWLINNATRGRIATVLTRTSPDGGPRGFDLYHVDKNELAEGAYTPLPKVRTLGIRGADISGIRYHDATVPVSRRVGAPGTGLETVLRGLQLTRTMCAGLALGGAEHALRIATGLLRDETASDEVRRTLVDAYADHLCNEVVGTVAARCVHHVPGEMSVVSAVAKYLVPLRADAAIRSLGELLGLDAVTGEGPAAMFEKVARDNRIVDLFDGNRVVNLHAVVNQFPMLALTGARPLAWPEAEALFDVGRQSPDFDPRRLRLVAAKGVTVLRALSSAIARCEDAAEADRRLRPVAEAARALGALADAVAARMRELPPAPARVPVAHFALAERFALVFAGAAALQTWLANRAAASAGPDRAVWRDGAWLSVVLRRVLAALGDGGAGRDEDAEEVLLSRLVEQEADGYLFSLWSCRLAERGRM
ncbi:acyl-CoA dehydrogenase family protein [Streptomyces sp. NPDC093595]|uniref:acyl-CoA dehydrogenase family protein n=1 Tax=Streptomyces sp. NPDC093595 TaxID=3366045 RepID=UPI003816DDFB